MNAHNIFILWDINIYNIYVLFGRMCTHTYTCVYTHMYTCIYTHMNILRVSNYEILI